VETPSTSAINLYRKQYFDGFGRVYRTAVKGPDANDNVQDTTYNARGLVASQSMPSMETSPCDGLRKPACPISFAYAYAYDGLNRLTATRFPDGHGTTQSYPLWGQTTTDEHGHTTTVQLDAYGNRVWLRQNQGVSAIFTRYTYDLLGRMVGMTDHLSNAWSWTFDSLGRNTQKTDPDAGTWGFTYYDSGLMHTQLDAKGQTTSFTYDNAGRLATKANVADTVTITRGELRGTYSNVGRVTTIRAGVGVTPVRSLALDYDARGRAVRQTRTMDTGETYVASKVYASGGYLQSITYPDGDTVGAMGYDAAGRLYSIPGIVNSIQYDAAGRATLQANFNGTTTTRAYSPRGFLTAIATTGSTQSAIQNLVYTPDPAGLVTQVTSPFPNESWTYDYDNLHRLTAATGDNSQTFQYDEIGRITFNSRVGTYTYPSPGIPGSPAHAPDHVASQIISYDANGNTTSGRKGSVTWNADNVPSQINGTWFMYDGLGERLRKVTGSSTSIYPLGDDYEITNGVVTKYISVDGLGVIAKRVGTSPNITTYWLHTDRLGSVQAVTDANNGVLVQRRTYLPYGDKIADTTAHAESRGWIDQRTDGETRLTYLHARYYDPELGLFLSPDPLHPAEPGVGLNRYSYGLADPINGSDENGLEWTPVCGVADDRWECSWLWVPDPREPYGDGEDPIDPTRPGWDRGDDPGQNPTDPGNVIPPIIVPPPCAPNCELPGVDGGTVVDIVAAATGIEDVIKLLAPNSTRQQRLQALATIGVMVVTDGLGSLFTKAAATTALGRSIRSLTSSLETGSGSWLRLSAHAETAAGRAYRGGTSIEEVFINPATGERLVRHTIVRDGNILHQTFRPDAKFGGE
jgi:RHS repeat-associated protein